MAPSKSPARKSITCDILARREDHGSVRKKGRQPSLDYDGVVCAFCGKRISRSNVSHHMKGFHHFDYLRNRDEGKTGWHDKDGRKIVDQMYFEENDLDAQSESVYAEVQKCLEPGIWLTDAALETIVKFYVKRDYPDKKIEILPIALAKAWREGFVDKPALTHSKPEVVIAIMHSGRAGGHWSCLFLNTCTKTFGHLDSMEAWHQDMAMDFGRSFFRSLNIETPYYFKELVCGLQMNDFDCGIHVISNIRKGLDQIFFHNADVSSIHGVIRVDSSRLRRQIRKDMAKELASIQPKLNKSIVDLTLPKSSSKKQKLQLTQVLDISQIEMSEEQSIVKPTLNRPVLQCCICSEWFQTLGLKLSKRQKENFRCSACKASDRIKPSKSVAKTVMLAGGKVRNKDLRPDSMDEAVAEVDDNDDNLPVLPNSLVAKRRLTVQRRSPRYSRDMRNLLPNFVTSEDGFKMETSTPHHSNFDDQTFVSVGSELAKSGPSSPASDTMPRQNRSDVICSTTFTCPNCSCRMFVNVGTAVGSADTSAAPKN